MKISFLFLFIILISFINCSSGIKKDITVSIPSLKQSVNVGDTLIYEIEGIGSFEVETRHFTSPEMQHFLNAKLFLTIIEKNEDSINFKMGILSASERSRFSDGLGRGFMKMESTEDLIGKEWQYTLTSSGLTESFDNDIYNFLSILFPFVLPGHPVSLGSSWKKRIDDRIEITLHFVDMKGDEAVIECKNELDDTKVMEKDSGKKEYNVEKKTNAKVIFNTRESKVSKINEDIYETTIVDGEAIYRYNISYKIKVF
jgi:hypothetical protein